ncbi:uncharacterized protein LOC18437532 [Amborella trichopoda]|nr:uncharacterized protein LOC18437532 [Amborella trichopoda]|eukprot:XP_006847805.2 uncharacterized protein LOC18437532 [Amborella trichopoda]
MALSLSTSYSIFKPPYHTIAAQLVLLPLSTHPSMTLSLSTNPTMDFSSKASYPSIAARHVLRLAQPACLQVAACAAPRPPSTAVKKKREPRGITKPRPVSPAMRDLLGVSEIPRTQALKLIWAYIKEHNLQDPENKKIIVCDEKLKTIFGGRDRVGFLEISGLINPHFLKEVE